LSFVAPLMKIVQAVTTNKTRQPRRSPRLPLKTTAQLRCGDRSATSPVTVRNISVGGASVVSHVRLRGNERVRLSLMLGGTLKFDLQARIVHAGSKAGSGYTYGLKFFALSETDHKRLSSFIHDPQNGWQFDAPPPPWEPEAV